MEKTGLESPLPLMINEVTAAFPPHRKSHLKSKTVETFLRILSLCVDKSQNYPDLQIISENTRTGGHCLKPELTTPQASQGGNSLAENGMRTNKSNEQSDTQNKAFNSSEIVNEIEHIVGTEGDGEHQFDPLMEERYLAIVNELETSVLQDLGQGAQELMDSRLLTSVKSTDNTKDRTSCLERNFGDMIEHERQQIERDTFVDSSLSLLDDKETEEGEILGGGVASQSDDLFIEDSIALEERTVGRGMIEKNGWQIERDALVDSSLSLLEDKETEEGEILDGEITRQSYDLCLEDSMSPEERKVDEERVPRDHVRQEVFEKTCSEQKGAVGNDTASISYLVETFTSIANHSQEQVKLRECDGKERKYSKTLNVKQAYAGESMPEAGVDGKEDKDVNGSSNFPVADSNSLRHSGEFSLKAATENKENPSTEKVKVGDKRKRSKTSERKARKKLRERKKRVEKNRQQGVKRLKLQPILKPKPVRYCNFYLNGRCQQNGKQNLEHSWLYDTTQLNSTQPSLFPITWGQLHESASFTPHYQGLSQYKLQGDSCKFSHDTTPLTKSQPCKFLALNSCLKGDDCPFDHQLSKYPCNNYKSKGFCNRGDKCLFSHKIMDVESSTQASNGSQKEPEASSLLPCTDSRRQLHNNSSTETLNTRKETTPRTPVHRYLSKTVAEAGPKRQVQTAKPLSFSGRKLNNSPSFQTLDVAKGATSRTPSSVENLIHRHPGTNVAESGLKPPAQTPKGISFLSFGKPLFDYASKHPQHNSPPERERGSNMLSGKSQSESEKFQNPNEMPCNTPASPFSLCHSPKQGALEKFQNSNRPPWKILASQLSLSESTKTIAEAQNKNRPSSAQKALLSTMAFASKYQSQMMIDRSVQSPSFNIDIKGSKSSNPSSSGNIQKESMTASKILQEFLFGGGHG